MATTDGLRRPVDPAGAARRRRLPRPDAGRAPRSQAWDQALALGETHGYRNAQATVIAPTGTIGLVMDCDTTGIEPDFALVKFKKLAGGGYFKIINRVGARGAAERSATAQAQIDDDHQLRRRPRHAGRARPAHQPRARCAPRASARHARRRSRRRWPRAFDISSPSTTGRWATSSAPACWASPPSSSTTSASTCCGARLHRARDRRRQHLCAAAR